MCTKAVCVCDTRGAGVALHACQVIIPSDTTAEREKQEHSARKSQSLSQRRISSHSIRQMNPVTTESEFEVSRRESWRRTTYEVNTRVRTLPTFFFPHDSWTSDTFLMSAEHFCLMAERVWVRMCENYITDRQKSAFLRTRSFTS